MTLARFALDSMDPSSDSGDSGSSGDAAASPSLAPSPTGPLSLGTVLRGRLSVDEYQGHIGLGDLYRGADSADGRAVAILLVSPELLHESSARILLQQDMAVAAQLAHKNIAPTLGFFSEQGEVFVVSEAVDGPTLREMLEGKRRGGAAGFSLKGAYNVVTHLCNALEYAHASLPHGLLSLDTVRVNGAGRVKVCDFGFARALAQQAGFRAALGPAITAVAPEIFGAAPDRRADLYSVGAILFELLTGRPRDGEDDLVSVAAPGVPAAVDPILTRCLRLALEDRPHDAHELKVAIHGACESALAASAGPAVAPHRPPPVPLPLASVGPALRPPSAPPFRSPVGPRVGGPPPLQRTPAPGAVLAPIDESHERWLIQKDKLDLGPFKLAEVRAQVSAARILGEHTIVDMESGARTKVKDHPLLRDLVRQVEGALKSQRELERIEGERRAARRRTTWTLSIAAVAVIASASALTAWLLTHKPRTETRIVYRDKEGGDDNFKIEIMMKVDPPAPRKKPAPGAPHKHPGGKGGSEFDSATNLGDASEAGGDETLDEAVVQKVMSANFRLLKGCVLDEKQRRPDTSRVEFDFIIRGSGQVSAVKANGATDSPLASCIYAKMQAVPFPRFNGTRTHASFSLALK